MQAFYITRLFAVELWKLAAVCHQPVSEIALGNDAVDRVPSSLTTMAPIRSVRGSCESLRAVTSGLTIFMAEPLIRRMSATL
jgi:hypothetical protein